MQVIHGTQNSFKLLMDLLLAGKLMKRPEPTTHLSTFHTPLMFVGSTQSGSYPSNIHLFVVFYLQTKTS